MSEPAAIEARGIDKGYPMAGRRLEVLSGLDLRVETGTLVAVVGVSGVGKSTLLHVLGGVDRPDRGSVLHAGRDLASLDNQQLAVFRNREIGFVFQFHYLLPEFSAAENVMMPLLIGGRRPAQVARQAHALLEEVGLGERAEHRPAELSGGEQQRVALARALACEPRVLLCDEPTGNLDLSTGAQVYELLRERVRARGLTTIVVTHNLELARAADRILRLDGGKVLELRERSADA